MSSRSCDLIVVGATLGGCLTALAAARRGTRVVLVEPTPFLGSDLTAVLRPWLRGSPATTPSMQALRDLLAPAAEAADANVDVAGLPAEWQSETPLFRGSIRKQLSAALEAQAVVTLLLCTPAGVLCGRDGVTGLLLAAKQGLLRLDAPLLVDCTATADVLRLFSPELVPEPPQRLCRFTVGFAGAQWPAARELEIDPAVGLAGNRVIFHAGRNSACSLWAEFALEVSTAAHDRRTLRAQAEFLARERSVALTRELIRTVPAFSRAVLAELAATLWEPPPPRPSAAALPAGLLRGPDGLAAGASWDDVAQLQEEAERWAAVALAAAAARGPLAAPDGVRLGPARLSLDSCQFTPLDDPALGVTLAVAQLHSLGDIPLAAEVDVLVAGGGTAGANAAAAALEAGAATAVLEQLSDLGGTQTLGLVAGYYHGYRGGFTAILDERVAALAEEMHPGRSGNRRIIKMLHYLRAVVGQGGRWLPGAVVCGSDTDQGRVRGLLAADRDGLFRVSAKLTVDATGDGDAAVFCGVRTHFGDPRSGTAQDCSQWSLGHGGWQNRSADLDVIDQRRLSETQRGLRLAHRKGHGFDFAAILTVREGRHIEGEYTLDLRDILGGRSFDDTLAVACTDWDPHGISTSWLGRLGFLPVHTTLIPVRIPLRCCIPKGLCGLLVTAKAISATTDAACLCRMAPDVQNLGYATGLAAAAAAAAGGDPRELDLRALTARLRGLGVVSDQLPVPWPVPIDLCTVVQQLASGDETALLSVALQSPDEALPRLLAAFAQPGVNRLQLAKALAWFGSTVGADLLVSALGELSLAASRCYDDTHPHKAGNPRAGIVDAADDYWRLNQLLALLGIARVHEAAATVAVIIADTTSGGPPERALNAYIRERIDMQRVPHFDRLLNLAFCAERLGEPRLGTALDGLLERQWIGGWGRRDGEDSGRVYHSALAEVLLAAAAARCGSRLGARRLAGFLDDVHDILASFALAELREISGQDLGRNPNAWATWLTTLETLPPCPVGATERVF
jgi:hypothetical protein